METTFLVPLLLLLISGGVGILIRQSGRQSDKLDTVKDTMTEQKVDVARLQTQVSTVESRVNDIHARKNDEQAQVFRLAADALLELRDDRRRRTGDAA